MSTFGIDIGGTTSAVLKAARRPDRESRPEYERISFATGSVEPTLAAIFAAIEELDPGREPLFGISCGDPQDAERGIILGPPNLPGWDEVPIAALLTERFGGRAHLMNDANAGALAEWYWGAGRGTRNMIFCTHGTGMGAGLILDGRLYEGTTRSAGEIGHMRLAPDGPVGYGKAGSLEGLVSGGGIAQLAQAAARTRPGAAFVPPEGIEGVTTKLVAEAARTGDDTAREILEESGSWLGRGLAILIDVLNPEVIVLGSLFIRLEDILRPPMEAELRAECLPHTLAACRILAATLGEQIGDLAALATALYRDL